MSSRISIVYDKDIQQRVFKLIKRHENVHLIDTILSITASSQSIYTTDTLTISGVLKDIENNVISDASIRIYKNNVLLDTVTTGNDGSYSKVVSGLSSGTYSFHTSFAGDSTYENTYSSNVSVTVLDPIILTTTDVSKVYRSSTQFVATVTCGGEPYGEGENVTFMVDSDSTYNREIGSDGKAKLNLPFNAGTHTITSSYGGITNTNTVTISKAPTTTTLTASSTSISTTDTLTISGEVTGNYLSSTSGLSVKLYDGSTLVDTLTLSSGAYSTQLTGLSAGTHNFKVVYEESSNYSNSESSVVSVTVTGHNYALALSGTSIIQSGDTDTITATVTDGGSAVSGAVMSYQIKHNTTTLDSGTATTNSSGVATISYTGTGVGDVDVIVSNSGMSLQEIYAIEDLWWYDTQTTDKGYYTTTVGSATLSYSSNGFKCVGTASVDTFVKNTGLTLPTNYEAEFTVTEKFGSHYGGICLDDLLINFGGSDITYYRLSTLTTLSNSSVVLTVGDVFKVEKQSNTMKVYRNGSLLKTLNDINTTGIYQHRIYNNRGHTVKNLKVKAL